MSHVSARMVTGTASLRGPTPGARVPRVLGVAQHAHLVYLTEGNATEGIDDVAMAQLVDGLLRMLGREEGW